MISLNLEQRCLIELIKASLFGVSPKIPENVNWEYLFVAAKKQCLVPMVTASVPKDHRDEWITLSARVKAYFMQMIYAQNSLVKLLTENSIPFIILKGTAASIYYPTPLLRTFGDIDFYVAEEHVDQVINLLKNNGYVFVANDDRHYEFEKYGIDFELHYRFSCKHYNDIEDILQKGLNDSVEYQINQNSFPGLPVCANGLVLLGHIMQHLKTSGIGLRQIIDWMMFVNKELDDYTWDNQFRAYAVEAGLDKLAITVTYMCKKWLGLSDKITWCSNADDEVADQLFIRVLDDGNLGNERTPWEIIRQAMRKEGVVSFLQHEGLKNWTWSQKCAVFRPFAWLYQIFRYICQGFARLFTGKKIFRKDNTKMKLEELWKRLE